jgi:LacI family transcriptional regulator
MATIKDVARRSGVSTTTVSFVLNGTGSVGADARERVLKAASDLGYTPNPLARAMITRRTQSLGVLVNNVESFNSSHMVSGIEEAARRQGYEILLALHRDEPETAMAAVRDLTARRVDAIISVYAKANQHSDVAEALAASGIPFVVAFYLLNEEGRPAIDNIVADQEQGGYLAGKRLIEQGRTRIAFAGGEKERNATRKRLAGLRRAMDEAGLVLDDRWVLYGDFEVWAGLEMGPHLLKPIDGQIPDGVFAANDDIAAGLFRVFRAAGKSVPQDIAVVGFNDSPVAEALDPPLSSIKMPLWEIGERCVEHAISRLEEGENWKPRTLQIPCTLTIRESA